MRFKTDASFCDDAANDKTDKRANMMDDDEVDDPERRNYKIGIAIICKPTLTPCLHKHAKQLVESFIVPPPNINVDDDVRVSTSDQVSSKLILSDCKPRHKKTSYWEAKQLAHNPKHYT